MGSSALGKLVQRGHVASDEGLLLCSAPFLDLALVFDRIRDSIEPLREHQFYWPARLRVSPEYSVVVLSDPNFKR
jgi:hypothetical protein